MLLTQEDALKPCSGQATVAGSCSILTQHHTAGSTQPAWPLLQPQGGPGTHPAPQQVQVAAETQPSLHHSPRDGEDLEVRGSPRAGLLL